MWPFLFGAASLFVYFLFLIGQRTVTRKTSLDHSFSGCKMPGIKVDCVPINNVKGRGKKSSISNITILADEPVPCKVCSVLIEEGSSIRCDSCSEWVHLECTDLTTPFFNFLKKKDLPQCIKWHCPNCENMTDKPNTSTVDRIDRLETLITTVTRQNAQILQSLHSEKTTVENKIKVCVTEHIEDQKQIDDRKKNAILFNIPESGEGTEGKKEDLDKVKKVIKHVCPDMETDDLTSSDMFRLGDKREVTTDTPNPNPRPIKIILKSSPDRDSILKNARKLKGSIFQKVGISADKTKKEREIEMALRQEFAARKLAGEDIVLFRNQIYPSAEAPWLKRNNARGGPGDPPKH